MLKKKSFYVMTLLIGILLLIGGILAKNAEVRNLAGVLTGVGAGLIGMSGANLWMRWFEAKNPEVMRENEIEFKDERNTMIRNRAKAKAGDLIQWLVMGLAYVMIIIDAPLWVVLVTVGVFLLYNVISVYYMNKYQNEM